MIRTLIIYGTRRGTTENTVSVIAETLILRHHHVVEISNIKKIKRYKHRFDEFDNYIIGSSIVSGRWINRVLRFLRKHDFEDRKVALFVTAGNTMDKVQRMGLTQDQAREEAIQNYITKYLDKFSFVPVDVTAFGGMVVRSGIQKYNTWNRNDIESWAIRLGKLFARKEEKEPTMNI